MSFGTTINISRSQIAASFGAVTLIKLPGHKGKAVMIASRYVNHDSFWINPNWNYKIKSGKGYNHDYGEWSAQGVLSCFSSENIHDQYDAEKHAPKVTDTDAVVPTEVAEKADNGEVEDRW